MINKFRSLISSEMEEELILDPEAWHCLWSQDPQEQIRGVMIYFVERIKFLSVEQIKMIPSLLLELGVPAFYKWDDPVSFASTQVALEVSRRTGRPIIKL